MEAAHTNHNRSNSSIGFDWYNVGRWGALGIIGYFLLTEHLAHVFQFLPFALLLACPFMHLFMHHGQHAGHSNESTESEGGHKHDEIQNKESNK